MNRIMTKIIMVVVVIGVLNIVVSAYALTPMFPGPFSSDVHIAATNDPNSVGVGESTNVGVDFWGEDVKPCSVYVADVENINYGYGDILHCDNGTSTTTDDDTITATIIPLNGASSEGLEVSLSSVFGVIGAEPPAYGEYYEMYYADFSLTGVEEGDYEVRFTVYPKVTRFFGASDTIDISVGGMPTLGSPDDSGIEPHTIVTDSDGDGSFTPGDCDDTDATIYPGAVEVCDSQDNNCDLIVDEGLEVPTYYLDADGDGHGTSNVSITVCPQPSMYAANNDDCNDSRSSIYPGAEEFCDGLDNDCDGVIDGPDCAQPVDADADGYLSTVDCVDSDASINPGASDDCTNQIDMNCDNTVSGCATSPQIDPITPVVQDAGVYGDVSGGADVGGCGCVVMGNANPYQLSTFMIFVLSLLGGGMFRFFRKK